MAKIEELNAERKSLAMDWREYIMYVLELEGRVNEDGLAELATALEESEN